MTFDTVKGMIEFHAQHRNDYILTTSEDSVKLYKRLEPGSALPGTCVCEMPDERAGIIAAKHLQEIIGV